MKKLMALAAFAATVPLFAATYKQASQNWVELKMAQMEARIMSSISAASTATNEQEAAQVIQTSAQRSISDGYGIANDIIGTNVGTPTNGTPYYLVGNTSPSITNSLPCGTVLWESAAGVYTNDLNTVMLVEGYRVNTISVLGLSYTLGASADDRLFTSPSDTSAYSVVTKYFK